MGAVRLLCIAGLSLSAACTTTLKSETVVNEATAEERAALAEAVANVAEARWPKPSSSSFADRLAGAEDDERISRGDAADAYLEILKASGDAEAHLMGDAQAHLAAADALKEAAEIARDSRPRLSDVALIEDAISDLRDTRSIYLASLKEIDGAEAHEKELKRSFDAVLKELGDVADELAENSMKQNSGAFARSDALRTAGSF